MKDIKEYLTEAKVEFTSWEQYLNSLKTKKTSYDEFSKIMEEQFGIYVDEFNAKDHTIDAVYNPYNNAEGNDILLTINVKGNERSFNVVDYDTEE